MLPASAVKIFFMPGRAASLSQSRHITRLVDVESGRVKSNATDFVLSASQPRSGPTVARETHEIVKVLATEDGWNANRVIVSGGDDAVVVVECCNQLPKCRLVDQGLIGKCYQHSVARIVRKECSHSNRQRRSEPFFPIGINCYCHRREARQSWRNCRCVRAEDDHYSTGASVKSGDCGPPHEWLFLVDDQLLWETESRRCSCRENDCPDSRG